MSRSGLNLTRQRPPVPPPRIITTPVTLTNETSTLAWVLGEEDKLYKFHEQTPVKLDHFTTVRFKIILRYLVVLVLIEINSY